MTTAERIQRYNSFQERFPIEKLEEMTLEEYTNLDRSDSFCYWIESRTGSLGSFWGGSSFKFGIYCYKNRPSDTRVVSDDKYAWYTSLKAGTAQEAFAKIRNTVVKIANAARTGDFEVIDGVEELGPSYKWKIAFLYSDFRLIPIYRREYLVGAAEAMGIANAASMKVSAIQRRLMEMAGNQNIFDYYDFLWKNRTGTRQKQKSELATEAKDTESAVITDGSKVNYWWLVASPKYWTFSDIKVGEQVVYTVKNDKGNKRRIPANFEQAKTGDIVIGYEANPVKCIVALAKVSKASDGETISFVKTETLSTPVSWFDFKNSPEIADMEFIRNPNGSFFHLTEDEYNFLVDLIRQENPEDDNPLLPVDAPELYDDKKFLSEVFMSEYDLSSLKKLLRHKKNIILQGAPGVGKTFSAKRLAYVMMGVTDDSRVKMVQFHQNYSYEDFIMGYKPTASGFELREGVFYEFCRKAANDPDRDYYFIIDEINRGNLSKIFGELLMLIENGYRGTTVQLAYRKEEFAVPENLYLIGMMNTADRSLAMIDYALRRRFSFFTMHPGLDTAGFKAEISRYDDKRVEKVVEVIRQLNSAIANDDSLGDGFRIGHSYFCNHDTSTDWIENVVRYDICPMLEEYWFDNNDKRQAAVNRLLDALKI
ncbi:MAG: hypothetical protein BHV67_13365 [Bacteroidales bacterium 43_36]|nr:MAG: hypothetical protein BHV67_13365 [Bacteroidales bacterium 43_36]